MQHPQPNPWPHVEHLIEPSFDNNTYRQFTWNAGTVTWYKTTWRKEIDVPTFGVIENLKYIGTTIEPTITSEEGTFNQLTSIQP